MTYTLLTPALHRSEYPLLRAGRRDHRQPDAAHLAAVPALRAGDGGGMLSTVLMMPLVNFIGGEDKSAGLPWRHCCALGGRLPDAGLLFFFTTKERVEAPPSSTSMREDLRDIWRNDQWRIVGVLTILNILAVCVRGGAMMYYTTGSWARRRCSPSSSPPTASAT